MIKIKIDIKIIKIYKFKPIIIIITKFKVISIIIY
jgi:hypothetical protein